MVYKFAKSSYYKFSGHQYALIFQNMAIDIRQIIRNLSEVKYKRHKRDKIGPDRLCPLRTGKVAMHFFFPHT